MSAVWSTPRPRRSCLPSVELDLMVQGVLQPFDQPTQSLIALFESGEIEVMGRMPYSSNATLLVSVTGKGDRTDIQARAIYKPGKGERPLHDFPSGLYRREVAMFRLSNTLGFRVVPPTTLVEGPLGEGSIQAFVNADFEQHYFTQYEAKIAIPDLQKLCVLDLIANNTDRKSGHCLLAGDGHVYGIDHGLAFHAQWKLRTVMWDFVGEPIPDPILEAISGLVTGGLPQDLAELLDPIENDAMLTRAKAVLDLAEFPEDETGGHRYPWPLV